MWARHVEVMLALWLALSGFIFEVPARERDVWAIDLGAALVIGVSSAICHWPPAVRAHLVTLMVAVGLIVVGIVQPRPVPSWHQNHIMLGLVLAMFALIPSHADSPPKAWQNS